MINCNAFVTPIETRDKLSRRLVRSYLMQLYARRHRTTEIILQRKAWFMSKCWTCKHIYGATKGILFNHN